MAKILNFLNSLNISPTDFIPRGSGETKFSESKITTGDVEAALNGGDITIPIKLETISFKDEMGIGTDGSSSSVLHYPADLFSGTKPFIYFRIKSGVRLSDPAIKCIALYMPPDIQSTYSSDWETTTLPIKQLKTAIQNIPNQDISGSMADLNKMRDSISSGNFGDALDTFQSNSATNVATRVAAQVIERNVGGISDIVNEVDVNNRSLVNPHLALVYKGPNFRMFEFQFELQARSYDESESIRKIVKMFKWASHPDTNWGNLTNVFLEYPNIFEINLYTPSNKWMFNIEQCVLSDINVDYGGAGATSFFTHQTESKSGAPVFVKLRLQFKEINILTKDKIEQNY